MNTRADEPIFAKRGFRIPPGDVSYELCFQLQELRPGAREGSCPMGFGRNPPVRCAPLSPEKAQALQQPLPLPPQSRQRRIGGVMSTPQLTFSEPDPSKNGDSSTRERPTSTYCGECICGRHFEIRCREWVCPDCHRQLVVEWAV